MSYLDPEPGLEAKARWHVALPSGGGVITTTSSGCIVSSGATLTAFSQDGLVQWQSAITGHVAEGGSVVTHDGDGQFAQIENGQILLRDLQTGVIELAFPAARGSLLTLCPWDAWVYTTAAIGGIAAVHVIGRAGESLWSIALDGPEPLYTRPLALADVIVIERRGLLWAYDSAGQVRWVVDAQGLRAPTSDDERRKPEAGVRLNAAPATVDKDSAVISLERSNGRGLYLLDAAASTLVPVAVPSPAQRPFVVLADTPSLYRIAGLGAQVDLAQMDWRFPIVCMAPDGAVVWQHLLTAKALTLDAAPRGNLIATTSPTYKRWRDYSEWYDMSRECFVRCIAPDGSARWTWHGHGPLTHLSEVSADGTVYVGCDGELWALPVS
jgi:hypothetical protein